MESVNKKMLIVAVVMALATTFVIYMFIKNTTEKQDKVEYVNVYIASKTLPAKYKVTEGDIKQAKIQKEYVNPEAILNKTDIIGKNLKESIIEGEQILKSRLINEKKTNLAYNIPQGKRAVSINVNDQSDVSNLIRPNDYVDIIASFDKEEFDVKGIKMLYPKVTKVIIQNVQILAISQEQLITDEKIKDPPKTVTLAVNPDDAVKLVYATEYAVVRLALRPAGDDKKLDTPEIIRNDIVSEKGVK